MFLSLGVITVKASEPKVYNEWTVNLILWYIHAVARNNSNVQWKYLPLEEETALLSKHLRLQDQVLAPVGGVSSKDPEKDCEDRDQSSTDKVPSDGIAPSDSKQPWDGKTQSYGTASSDIGAFTKGKRRREDSEDQMSTKADNDVTTARRKPKQKKGYNLRMKPTPSSRAGQ